jgi:hypothetical protein
MARGVRLAASFGSWGSPFASSITNACSSSRTDEAGKAAREHGRLFPAKQTRSPRTREPGHLGDYYR